MYLLICSDFYWRGNRFWLSLPKKYRDALPVDFGGGNGRRKSDKTELPDDVFLKKHGFPRQDAAFRNVEMLHYFFSSLPTKAIKFFAGLSNSVVSRTKLGDQTQRATAITITDRMSDIFLDLLRYDETNKSGDAIDLHLYWVCVTNFVHSILSGGICFESHR